MGALGYAYTKMPAVDKYKPNSIKNAIRYRFQIKAKYYRNLTVLEKAKFTLKYNSFLPYQGNHFSDRRISTSQHNEAHTERPLTSKDVNSTCYKICSGNQVHQCPKVQSQPPSATYSLTAVSIPTWIQILTQNTQSKDEHSQRSLGSLQYQSGCVWTGPARLRDSDGEHSIW